MVVDSTVQTSSWQLTANDRCDAECSAQAYIKIIGVSGELMFCVHHYEKIMSNPSGYDAMMKFGFEFLDERERLIENRLIGDNV
tara:strand:+ start:555 stop:806 length:252 start_codon:yes stop_codon:yes gene_type:complete